MGSNRVWWSRRRSESTIFLFFLTRNNISKSINKNLLHDECVYCLTKMRNQYLLALFNNKFVCIYLHFPFIFLEFNCIWGRSI